MQGLTAPDPIFIQVQDQLNLLSEASAPLSPASLLAHLFRYKLVFIGNKKLYASLPPENN